MENKEILSQLLEKMKPFWDLAEGMQILIGSHSVTEEVVDGLIHVMYASMEHIQDQQQQEKMGKAIEIVQQLHQQSQQQESQDQKDADVILDQLNSL